MNNKNNKKTYLIECNGYIVDQEIELEEGYGTEAFGYFIDQDKIELNAKYQSIFGEICKSGIVVTDCSNYKRVYSSYFHNLPSLEIDIEKYDEDEDFEYCKYMPYKFDEDWDSEHNREWKNKNGNYRQLKSVYELEIEEDFDINKLSVELNTYHDLYELEIEEDFDDRYIYEPELVISSFYYDGKELNRILCIDRDDGTPEECYSEEGDFHDEKEKERYKKLISMRNQFLAYS